MLNTESQPEFTCPNCGHVTGALTVICNSRGRFENEFCELTRPHDGRPHLMHTDRGGVTIWYDPGEDPVTWWEAEKQ